MSRLQSGPGAGAHPGRPDRRELMAGVLGMLAGLLPAGARAHHGFGGRYDTSRPVWFQGEVTRVRIGMPHPELALRLPASPALPSGLGPEAAEFLPRLLLRPEDRDAVREVEFPPVARFLELGPEIRAGDVVAVIALRNCVPPHQMRGQWLRLASGRVVGRQGRMQSEVDGC